MYYVFDALEIILGPYDTHKEAEWELTMMVEECYLLDDFPNPYVDYIEEGDVKTKDWYWNTSSEECPPITRERIIKRKKVDT